MSVQKYIVWTSLCKKNWNSNYLWLSVIRIEKMPIYIGSGALAELFFMCSQELTFEILSFTLNFWTFTVRSLLSKLLIIVMPQSTMNAMATKFAILIPFLSIYLVWIFWYHHNNYYSTIIMGFSSIHLHQKSTTVVKILNTIPLFLTRNVSYFWKSGRLSQSFIDEAG
jgi:hypothetical protein